jgi:hypothetical protein
MADNARGAARLFTMVRGYSSQSNACILTIAEGGAE